MATCGSVKLLGCAESPFGNRVEFALNLKGIPYELMEEDLFNKSELLLASNPVHKKVPVLVHGDKPISESLAIVEYIDEFWSDRPSNILPSDPFDRATARFWASYVDNRWFPPILKLRDQTPTEEEAKIALINEIKEGFEQLEEALVKCSKGKAFFGGDDIGYLDIALGSFWSWMLAIEILMEVKFFDEKQTPNLCKWFGRFLSHEAVKDVVVEPPKLVEFYHAIIARGWKF